MNRSILLFYFVFLACTAVNATTTQQFQVTGLLTNSTGDMSQLPDALQGTLLIDENGDGALSLTIGQRAFYPFDSYIGPVDAFSILMNGENSSDYYSDYGGYGDYYYETYNTVEKLAFQTASTNASYSTIFLPEPIDTTPLVSLGDLILSEYFSTCSYYYETEEQAGTPSISCEESETLLLESSVLTIEYFHATGADTSLTDTYNLSFTEVEVSAVPVPAAVWLFGSALVSLIGLKRNN
ncbi:hypothetical protein [Oceanicoccus sagamiensis]|uniref:Uncharacterized protein n=1 Tax=Oceanicoccus sagamiensis TaxID=716816 RepID=A0A1X9NCQ1_9GAMM|nr:hypothetical protein [Oceanicoccus sagamiensis]ARN73309.1 hypothetical protein BST96_03830 [Oceanicoccus sagamiensis]